MAQERLELQWQTEALYGSGKGRYSAVKQWHSKAMFCIGFGLVSYAMGLKSMGWSGKGMA